jgi:DNA-binding transcriptional LysR family regulator
VRRRHRGYAHHIPGARTKKVECLQNGFAELQYVGSMYDWNDIRVFLAAARARSMLGAAGELSINQSTVNRRITALETALGIRLFDRTRDGCSLNEAGKSLLSQAQRIAAEAETFERLVAQRKRNHSGVIRVTTLDTYANLFLTPLLSEFMELFPDLRVELIATYQPLNLARGEADIALRACPMPTQTGVVVRKLADDPWNLYCSRRYSERRGAPRRAGDLNKHVLIGAEGALAKLAPFDWLAKAAPEATARSVCSNLPNVLAAIKAGHGIGPLPNSIGIPPDLVKCFPMPDFKFGIYLMTRETLKDVPRVKALNKFIIAHAHVLKRALGA